VPVERAEVVGGARADVAGGRVVAGLQVLGGPDVRVADGAGVARGRLGERAAAGPAAGGAGPGRGVEAEVPVGGVHERVAGEGDGPGVGREPAGRGQRAGRVRVERAVPEGDDGLRVVPEPEPAVQDEQAVLQVDGLGAVVGERPVGRVVVGHAPDQGGERVGALVELEPGPAVGVGHAVREGRAGRVEAVAVGAGVVVGDAPDERAMAAGGEPALVGRVRQVAVVRLALDDRRRAQVPGPAAAGVGEHAPDDPGADEAPHEVGRAGRPVVLEDQVLPAGPGRGAGDQVVGHPRRPAVDRGLAAVPEGGRVALVGDLAGAGDDGDLRGDRVRLVVPVVDPRRVAGGVHRPVHQEVDREPARPVRPLPGAADDGGDPVPRRGRGRPGLGRGAEGDGGRADGRHAGDESRSGPPPRRRRRSPTGRRRRRR
jgi:hypothetical protein